MEKLRKILLTDISICESNTDYLIAFTIVNVLFTVLALNFTGDSYAIFFALLSILGFLAISLYFCFLGVITIIKLLAKLLVSFVSLRVLKILEC